MRPGYKVYRFVRKDLNRGGTIPIPKNRNSGSVGYFGGIGSEGIEKGIIVLLTIPHFLNRQKESRFPIPKFEKSCHL